MKIKNAFKKFMMVIATFAVLLTSFPINLLAQTPDSSLNDGDVINPVNQVGTFNSSGDVEFKKTISKTENNGEYEVKLEVRGKDVVSTTSTVVPIYSVIVFDRSGSMENHCKGLFGIDVSKGTEESCILGISTLYPRWTNAVAGARNFAQNLNTRIPNAQIALVTFAESASVNRGFNESNLNGVSFGEPYGGTNIVSGLEEARKLLTNAPENAKKIVVLVGDGEPEVTGNSSVDIQNTITKANELKTSGIEIYSIGYDDEYSPLSNTAINTLKSIATDDSHYSYSDTYTISNALTNLITSISTVNAGSSAIVKDTIKDGFSYVEGSSSIAPSSINGNKIEFNVGNITETVSVITFRIKANENLMPGSYETNDTDNKGVSLTYKDANGNDEEKVITNSSEVYINPDYNYTVNYYLDSKDNDSFDSKSGTGKYGDTINIDLSNIKDGYRYNGSETFTLDEKNKQIDVVYTKKTYKYIIDYFKDSLDNEKFDSKNGQAEYKDVITIDLTNIPHGYEYNGDSTFELLNDNYLKKVLYTKIGNLPYEINYYKDSVNASNFLGKESNVATYEDEINVDVTKFIPEGYEYNEELPTLKIDTENNIVNVVYTKKSYDYKVNYYKDEISEDNYLGEVTGTAKYQDEVEIDFEKYLPVGYESTTESDVLVILTQDNEYNVIYTKINITYEVNYYFDGKLKETKEVVLPYGDEVIINDEFDGYELDKIEYDEDNIINVYYKTLEEEYIIPPKTSVDAYNIMFVIELLSFALFIKLRKLN